MAGAATIIFKDIVSQFAAGLTIWFSKEYTPDDIVLIGGRKARIVRVGIKSTTFQDAAGGILKSAHLEYT